jgi:hypothetical protein
LQIAWPGANPPLTTETCFWRFLPFANPQVVCGQRRLLARAL